MSKKEEFKTVLKYGWCKGNDARFIDIGELKCHNKNPAHAPRTCGMDYNKECTCCDACRGDCVMLRIFKDSAKEKVEESFNKMQELSYEEEIKKIRTRR